MPDRLTTRQAVEASVISALRKSRPFDPPILSDLLLAYQTPGLSIAVIEDGQIAWTAGYGVRRAGRPDAVTPETRFQAASISKPVTCLAALRLVEAGVLDLDADVNDYLKPWRVPAVDGWQPRLTLRMLFSHSAGLSTSGFLGYAPDQPIPSVPDILEGAPHVNSPPVRVATVPGLTFSYSGGGTTIAQLVLTDVTGQNFPTYMRQQVLEPLGMYNSAFQHPPTDDFRDQCAHGHYYDGQPLAAGWQVHPELAAAGLWTTPSDLARFALAFQAAAQGQHPLISKRIAEWMTTPVVKRPGGQMALGFLLNEVNGKLTFGHTGGNVGFKCNLSAFVEGRGAAIMTNSDSGMEVCKLFDQTIMQDEPPSADAAMLAAADAPSVAGSYRLGQGEARVLADGDHLQLYLPGYNNGLRLTKTAPYRYAAAGLDVVVRFEVGDDGAVRTMTIEQAGVLVDAGRLP